MKKIFLAAFAGSLCFCISCGSKTESTSETAKSTMEGKYSEQEQKNMAASDVIMKAFQTGEVTSIDSVVSDDFIDHTDRGDMKGRDSLKSMVKFVHTNFKDMKTEKVRDVANEDFVYSWMRYSGTSDGSMGMPKGPYDMEALEVAKFRDGKAVEHWSFMDAQDMAKMMQPANKNNMDTGKKKK